LSLDPEGREVERLDGGYLLFGPGFLQHGDECERHAQRLLLKKEAVAAAFGLLGVATLDCGCRVAVCEAYEAVWVVPQ
jgi:hypothetical protein